MLRFSSHVTLLVERVAIFSKLKTQNGGRKYIEDEYNSLFVYVFD